MTVQKVISSGISNLGHGGTKKTNPFVDVSFLIATTKDFSIDTVVAAAVESGWTTPIKAKTVFPFPPVWDVEDLSVETTYAESGSKIRKKTTPMIKRKKFLFDVPIDTHRAMQTFDNADLRFIPVDRKNNIKFYKDGDAVKGFSASMVSAESMGEPAQDGSLPALSSIVVDFANMDEWDLYGAYITPTWQVKDWEPLTNVYLEQIGTATATLLAFRVYSYTGYTAAGAIDKVGISGLVVADLKATTTAGADQTSAFSGALTDNGDGTYSAITTGMATGTFNLVAASALSSGYFDSHFGTADGEATLTIT